MDKNLKEKKFYKRLSFGALVISSLAFTLSLGTFLTQRELNHLHITPEIVCGFEYPIVIIKNEPKVDKQFPVLKIQNDGPIDVASLSVDVRYYLYNKKKEEFEVKGQSGTTPSDHFIFKKTFVPGDVIEKRDLGIAGKGGIVVHEFNLNYYRPNDMKKISQQELFFIDDQNIFTHKNFISNPYYQDIIKEIASIGLRPSVPLFSGKPVSDNGYLIMPGKNYSLPEKGN